MNRVLTIEYEEFEDLETKVMSIVDSEKDEVLNIFHGDEAEELYNKLITVVIQWNKDSIGILEVILLHKKK